MEWLVGVAMLSEVSADYPFDDAHGRAWGLIDTYLNETGSPFPAVPATCSLELQGLPDVDTPVAHSDAAALIGFLHQMGALILENTQPQLSSPLVTGLDTVEVIRSPEAGVVIQMLPLGVQVLSGGVSQGCLTQVKPTRARPCKLLSRLPMSSCLHADTSGGCTRVW